MKQLFNYGNARIIYKDNSQVKTFLPNTTILVSEETATILLRLKNIKEIQMPEPKKVEPKKVEPKKVEPKKE